VTSKYEKAVAEARRLVSRSEEDQWRLAELTWQQVEAGKSRRQWAQDIGVDPSYSERLYLVWARFGAESLGTRPPFKDAYHVIERPGLNLDEAEDVSQVRHQEKAVATVRNMPPERKAEIVREAIKSDPRVAVAASDALDERQADWRASRPVKADRTEETSRDQQIAAQMLVVKLRAAHRNLAEAASLSQNIRGAGEDEMRSAVLSEIEWIRSVCEVIEAGVNGGPLDSQLQALLDAEAGR
jgi:hypothetical protein